MSRTGTGCATPGRSDAVSRTGTNAGCGAAAAPAPSELEIDEGIARSLRDHDRERHDRPDDRYDRRRRARNRGFERARAHEPVREHDAADDREHRDQMRSRQDRLGLLVEAEHAREHGPRLAERLRAEEHPRDVDERPGQEPKADDRERPRPIPDETPPECALDREIEPMQSAPDDERPARAMPQTAE